MSVSQSTYSDDSKRMRLTLTSIANWKTQDNTRYQCKTTVSKFNKDDSVEFTNQASPMYELLKRKRMRNDDIKPDKDINFITTPSFRKQLFKERFKTYCKYGGNILDILDRPFDSNSNYPYRYTIEWLKEFSKSQDTSKQTELNYLIANLKNLQNIHNSAKSEIDKYVIHLAKGTPVLRKWNGECVQCDSYHSGECYN
jgi:hypothetical protein